MLYHLAQSIIIFIIHYSCLNYICRPVPVMEVTRPHPQTWLEWLLGWGFYPVRLVLSVASELTQLFSNPINYFIFTPPPSLLPSLPLSSSLFTSSSSLSYAVVW